MKQAGLDLPDPKKTAPGNWTASCVITGHLVAALRGQEEFRMADHSVCLQEESTVVRKRRVLRSEDVTCCHSWELVQYEFVQEIA